jgi:hypothetical protein
MYFVIAKNEDSSWKAVFQFTYSTDARKNILDAALESNLPITLMETTSYRNQAKSGAVWDGSSFSGGTPADGVDYMELPTTDDYWNDRRTYAFICDNVIIAMVIAHNDTTIGSFLNEHLNKTDVRLIKVPADKFFLVGEDVQYDDATKTLL